jgi:Family of unknown function (DUF6159)
MSSVIRRWKTLTTTVGVVGRYRDCFLYPVSSCVAMWVVTFTAVLPLFEGVLRGRDDPLASRLLLLLAVYLAYCVLYFVTAFCNVALVTGIAARLDGGGSGLTVGLARAFQRIGLVAGYTLVSATIGLVAYVTRPLIHPVVGTLAGPAISTRLWERWHRISYSVPLLMAVPVLRSSIPHRKTRSGAVTRSSRARGESAHGPPTAWVRSLRSACWHSAPSSQRPSFGVVSSSTIRDWYAPA